jgi:hypothetical protein
MGRADPASRLINQYPDVKDHSQGAGISRHPPRCAPIASSAQKYIHHRLPTHKTEAIKSQKPSNVAVTYIQLRIYSFLS